jgi:hypothetical protein
VTHLLPIPCGSGQLDPATHLPASRWLVVAGGLSPSQSAGTDAIGASLPTLAPVGSATPRSASIFRRALRRHSSRVRAVCVNALVRICAGGDQRWSFLPRQLSHRPLKIRHCAPRQVGLCMISFSEGIKEAPRANRRSAPICRSALWSRCRKSAVSE